MKKLIIFYSLTGKTAKMVDYIKDKCQADILEIKPIKELGKKGIQKLFFGGMQVVMKKCPLLKDYKIDLNEYDCLIMGSPVWVGTFAPPLRSFMQNEKINNKKIFFFASHEGGMGKIFNNWEKFLDNNNKFLGNFAWNSRHDFNSIELALNDFCDKINKLT